MKQVWVAGRNAADMDPTRWAILGVFSTNERAVAVCADERDFVGPMYLDQPLPHDLSIWCGSYRPRVRAA